MYDDQREKNRTAEKEMHVERLQPESILRNQKYAA